MVARIYRPARNAMQSGKGKARAWVLEFEAEAPRSLEPLMGWTASGDMKQQLRLSFDTSGEAVAYAQRQGIAYMVAPEPPVRAPKKSYSDNFKWGRTGLWTH